MNDEGVFRGDAVMHHLARWILGSWRILLTSNVVGAVSAGLAVHHAGSVFEATALIQSAKIGRLGQVQQSALAGQFDLFGKGQDIPPNNFVEIGQIGLYTVSSRIVEPVSKTIGRTRSAVFLQDVAQQAGDAEWLDQIKKDNKGGVAVMPAKEIGSRDEQSLIELRVKARSPEIAQRRAAALVKEIESQQEMLAKPALEGLRATLLMADSRIQELSAERERLNKALDGIGNQDNGLGDILQVTSLLARNDAITYELRQLQIASKMSLDKSATQNAVMVDKIFISEHPTTVVKVRFVALGMLCGLILAWAGIIFVDFSRRQR